MISRSHFVSRGQEGNALIMAQASENPKLKLLKSKYPRPQTASQAKDASSFMRPSEPNLTFGGKESIKSSSTSTDKSIPKEDTVTTVVKLNPLPSRIPKPTVRHSQVKPPTDAISSKTSKANIRPIPRLSSSSSLQTDTSSPMDRVSPRKRLNSLERNMSPRPDQPPSYTDVNGIAYRKSRKQVNDLLSAKWFSGPSNNAGRLFDSSDRNILCMSTFGLDCVIGSHHEWVTCVDYLPNGRIISGGMDSKLCLWNPRLVQCEDLLGHKASISCVLAGDYDRLAVSGSYDKTLIVWDLKSHRSAAVLKGHKEAVMHLQWSDDVVISGDRGGHACIWDLESSTCKYNLKGHGKQISALDVINEQNVAVTGSLEGDIHIWDLRTGQSVFHTTMHPGGAVNGLEHSLSTQTLVTAGADRKIKVLDPRRSFEPVHEMNDHKDFIYSLKVGDRLVFSGGGNGWCLVHDLMTGKCLYGLGANAHAVRCIEMTGNYLVTAGDDGNAVVYDY
ncbi:hypothetical protein PROFUN_14195 [Planoprotostelium fungivorum]|uniref:Uncharacterized protein n=1 Tax=Planoprotostelium fungivorum TaxID=1890364 RepID=A0A2P6N362_9EUKA|nr:hypothetical protein PROFUN_14195 [Planoprotostelium fungivorum]